MSLGNKSWPYLVMEILSATLLLCCFVPLLFYDKLAGAEGPIHFDAAGNVDNTGDAKGLIFLGVMCLLLYASLSFAQKRPEFGNWRKLRRLSDSGREYYFANAWKLFLETKLVCMFILAYISSWTFQISIGRAAEMPVWGILAPLAVLVLLIVRFMYCLYNWN